MLAALRKNYFDHTVKVNNDNLEEPIKYLAADYKLYIYFSSSVSYHVLSLQAEKKLWSFDINNIFI
jgi:hypothetical protein